LAESLLVRFYIFHSGATPASAAKEEEEEEEDHYLKSRLQLTFWGRDLKEQVIW
jgi:hypothetical protein